MAKGKEARRGKEDEKKAVPAKAAPAAPVPAAKGKAAAPQPAEEVKVEEKKKKEKRSQKERPKSKKKHAKAQVWKLYKIEGGKAIRKNESCPRCGPGTFVAAFKNRKYCGKCGWSEITKVQ